MFGLDYYNDSVNWKFSSGRGIGSSPDIDDDGTILVGAHIGSGSGGELFALKPDGSLRWHIGNLCNEVVDSSPCIMSDGTVYIGSASDRYIPPGGYDESVGYLHVFGPVDSNVKPNNQF